MRVVVAVVIALLVGFGVAVAEDRWDKRSTGLVLLPLDRDLRVESVELKLSPGEVRLTYRIHNAGRTTKTLGITFPMPDVRGELFGETDNAALIPEGFRLTRDGRAIEGTLHQYVTALGVDRSDVVRELGLPLNPAVSLSLSVPGSFDAELNPPARLTDAQLQKLLRLGMTKPWIYEIVEGHDPPPPSYSAMWTLHSSYALEETFQPGERTEYVLSYPPAARRTIQMLDRYELGDYCAPPGVIEAARDSVSVNRWINFDAATLDFSEDGGLNGPIGEFRLILDGGAPNQLALACSKEPLRQTGPNRFEAVQSGDNIYLPRELRALFITPTDW